MNANDDIGPSNGTDSDDGSSVESPMSEEKGPLHLKPDFQRPKGPPKRSESMRSNTAVRKNRHPNKTKKERKKAKEEWRKSQAGGSGLEAAVKEENQVIWSSEALA